MARPIKHEPSRRLWSSNPSDPEDVSGILKSSSLRNLIDPYIDQHLGKEMDYSGEFYRRALESRGEVSRSTLESPIIKAWTLAEDNIGKAAKRSAELKHARAMSLLAGVALAEVMPGLELPFRTETVKSVMSGTFKHPFLTGDGAGALENLLHATNFRRDWNAPHHIYQAKTALATHSWSYEDHQEFLKHLRGEYVLRHLGGVYAAASCEGIANAVAGADRYHVSEKGMVHGFSGVEVLSSDAPRPAMSAEELALVEKLAEEQVNLELNPMANSW